MNLYLDTCHLIKLLDVISGEYNDLSHFIIKNNINLLVSDFTLTELFQAKKETLSKRSVEANKYNVLFLKSSKNILDLEIEHYKDASKKIDPITENLLHVLPVANPEFFPNKTYKITFAQFLNDQPQVELQKPMQNLYDLINSRSKILDFVQTWKDGVEKNLVALTKEQQQKIKPENIPSYTLYTYSYCKNHNTLNLRFDRNDLFDIKHCSYIPYADIFITDKNNAVVANAALKKLNDETSNPQIQTKIYKSVEDFLLNNNF